MSALCLTRPKPPIEETAGKSHSKLSTTLPIGVFQFPAYVSPENNVAGGSPMARGVIEDRKDVSASSTLSARRLSHWLVYQRLGNGQPTTFILEYQRKVVRDLYKEQWQLRPVRWLEDQAYCGGSNLCE